MFFQNDFRKNDRKSFIFKIRKPTMRKLLTICSLFSFTAILCAQAGRPPMDPMMNPGYERNMLRQTQQDGKRADVRVPVTFKDKVSSSAYPLSNKRLKQIGDIVKGFLDRNEKFNDEAVLDTIYEQVGKIVTMTPEKPADVRKYEDFQKEIAPQVNKKFPLDPKQVKEAAEKDAEKKFAMQKPREQVKVFYQRGNSTYSMTGTFYGYGYGNRSIQINERTIAIFDLLPESRIKFDKTFNQKAREEFISKQVMDYTNKKFAFANNILRKLQTDQRNANEKLGYIYADKKWNTAKKITDDAIEAAKVEAARRAEEARLKAEEERKRQAGELPQDGGMMGPDGMPRQPNQYNQNNPYNQNNQYNQYPQQQQQYY